MLLIALLNLRFIGFILLLHTAVTTFASTKVGRVVEDLEGIRSAFSYKGDFGNDMWKIMPLSAVSSCFTPNISSDFDGKES
ncbi:unnamed protein product [Taenia asiatica]|uniref:Secreted protein n=1 Tax=Taenia asiatica TaxID=60517 RepID=A0A0R3VXL1_TAEAS|nr:unnamed protein product [Taenia asiatica]